jgi:hypothetical protein
MPTPHTDAPLWHLGCISTMRKEAMLALIAKLPSADWLSSLNNGRRNHN